VDANSELVDLSGGHAGRLHRCDRDFMSAMNQLSGKVLNVPFSPAN
jgi:hypothetical protein